MATTSAMRVLLNDREIAGLDARLERRLAGSLSDRATEGVAISAAESVRLRRRELTWLVGVAVAAVVVTLGATLAMAGVRRPDLVGLLALVFGTAAALTAALSFLVVGVMVRAHARRVDRRAPGMTLAPGAAVRVDPSGVTVNGQTWPWRGMSIDELGVRQRQGENTQITFVERLALSGAQRRLTLDALFLTNGRTLLAQAWRRMRAP